MNVRLRTPSQADEGNPAPFERPPILPAPFPPHGPDRPHPSEAVGRGQAEEAWQTVLRVYPTAGTPAAWADYGLAVLEIDRDRFQEAIARLQGILEKGYTDDTEVYAYAYYQIGRIYLAFLHEQDKAEAAFQEVLTRYPESTPAKRHFWLD